MKCKICASDSSLIFNTKVLGKYDVNFFQCQNCSFTFTESPYWLNEAYENALNIEDTGILQRNLKFKKILLPLLVYMFGKDSKFLDWGGGYGIFTRLMRDAGLDYYWDDKYSTNLLAKGFEYNKSMEIKAISSFEVFEHLTDPIETLEQMLAISDTIIFSTELISTPAPKKESWWYYAFHHGQHIAFYSPKTFTFLCNKYNLNYYSNGYNLHMLSRRNHNKFWIKLIMKAGKYGADNFIILKSKTAEDSDLVSRKRIQKA